ncbi:hypothetical protein [Corynebacterium spheniscorum]|uniref:Secreted protein n=1 Tax=Corynebacterium spheniscorum TaxID=185761 RepID=A0A1I2UE67_9CORY|nr:hypothetical protein [Corynebacterium spheniscorum]KAA8720390.1 hypothetical protein F4V56_07775 [Corynebacterium spheniscorum]SFG75515.1 hypothetical protein SAMN05660282_01845 [Corynebacterium spheniscorum]
MPTNSYNLLRLPAVLLGTGLCAALMQIPATQLAPMAGAAPVPMSVQDPAVSEQWVHSATRPGEKDAPLAIDVMSVSSPTPMVPGDRLRIEVELHNTTAKRLTDIVVQSRRTEAVGSVAEARLKLARNANDYPYYGAPVVISRDLAPDEKRRVVLDIATDAAPGGLALPGPGVYPVLLTAQAHPVGQEPGNFATERFLLDATKEVRSEGSESASEGAAEEDQATPPEPAPATPTVPVGLIYPLAAEVDIVPGETGEAPEYPPLLLESEKLAEELAPGGRLRRLLDQWDQATTSEHGAQLKHGSCLAIDPALLEAVDRMSHGYNVGGERAKLAKQGQRLRDSWGKNKDIIPGAPGRGVADATTWIEDIQRILSDPETCVFALPWGNADLNAVRTTANSWLMREALQRGPAVITRVTGREPSRNIVLPGSGYISPQTAPWLGWADTYYQQDPALLSAGRAGLSDAWATAQAHSLTQPAKGAQPAEQKSNLEDTKLPAAQGSETPPQPTEHPVSALVANNTVWSAPQAGRFAQLSEGIQAVTYQDSLAATLAATGPHPETVGYSNPDSRYDYRLDSAASRDLVASAALRLAVQEQAQPTAPAPRASSQPTPPPLLAVPPVLLSADTARSLLDTTTGLFAQHQASPIALADYLAADPHEQAALAHHSTAGAQADPAFGSPYPDPSASSDTERLRVAQQANYTDDLTQVMVRDTAIALTPYDFTAPLRRELLSSLAVSPRRAVARHDQLIDEVDARLNGNRDILQSLRGSVALIPPGGVYTRASNASPLLAVAANGLPLPVVVNIGWSGAEANADSARIQAPQGLRIPARGSITVQMTADLPENELIDVRMWLSTPEGARISESVDVRVNTRSGAIATRGIVVATLTVLILLLLFRVGRARLKRPSAIPPHSGGKMPPR